MITTTAILLTSLLAVPQDPKPPQDSKPDVDPKIVAARIKSALEQGGRPAVETILKYGGLPAKPVTSIVGDALKHKNPSIRAAAIHALRYNTDKSAFVELYSERGNKLILRDAKIAEQYFLSLGQHADKRALPFLVRDLNGSDRRDPVLRSKVLAIGRIKERRSIDVLVKFVCAGRRRGGRDSAFTALAVLTGNTEAKNNAIAWARWWKANRYRFVFTDQKPELSKQQARTWTETWQVPGTKTETGKRSKKEKDRRRRKRK